ncbi:hypothetical protein Amn_06560 [Aminobacter sp. Y103A]|uniref:DUF1850 domain-containing protein n=1 Tax=Aminobacter sp. Y103A TaxID=1870862 RepID=UPI00257245C1|nr:DUF1850 domain-containing protein [Aminobacter sp. SS-2016]BBD35776.1 hypothetical protein Amn_06560 [Aminobacter sp. SS-2016]
MGLCIVAGSKAAALAVAAFTLSWTHSVEKLRWEEDWRVSDGKLQIVGARVQGSGAGMDPPEGAVFDNGWWRYTPKVGPKEVLVLAASGATGDGWLLCSSEGCLTLGEEAEATVMLRACDPALSR